LSIGCGKASVTKVTADTIVLITAASKLLYKKTIPLPEHAV